MSWENRPGGGRGSRKPPFDPSLPLLRRCHVIVFFSIDRTPRDVLHLSLLAPHGKTRETFAGPSGELESRRFFTSSRQWSRLLARTATDPHTARKTYSWSCCISLTRDKRHASSAMDLLHRRVVMDICSGGRFEKAHVIRFGLIPQSSQAPNLARAPGFRDIVPCNDVATHFNV